MIKDGKKSTNVNSERSEKAGSTTSKAFAGGATSYKGVAFKKAVDKPADQGIEGKSMKVQHVTVSLPHVAGQHFVVQRSGIAHSTEAGSIPVTSPETLGMLVRKAREERNLTQQQFADLAGVGRRFVSELESGKPRLEFAKVIQAARAAGIVLLAKQR